MCTTARRLPARRIGQSGESFADDFLPPSNAGDAISLQRNSTPSPQRRVAHIGRRRLVIARHFAAQGQRRRAIKLLYDPGLPLPLPRFGAAIPGCAYARVFWAGN